MKPTTAQIALVISLVTLVFTGLNFRSQRQESEMQLWSSLRREFDYDLKKERVTCGRAFAEGKLDARYEGVMDFFEVVGFLVKTGRLHDDLFDNTWGYCFSGYFQATKPFMEQDRRRDPRIYENVFYLAKRFPSDPSLRRPDDIKNFFEGESRLPQ